MDSLIEKQKRPTVANKPRLVPLQLISDPRGVIGVAEVESQIPFTVQRFYFLTDLPDGCERGGHAHKRLWQLVIPLRGGLTVELDDGIEKSTFTLESYQVGLLIPPWHWRELKNFVSNALVGVLASLPYDEGDYIREYGAFREACAANREPKSVPYLPLDRYMQAERVGALSQSIRSSVDNVIQSGQYIGGPTLQKFEKAFAAFCGTDYAVGVGNGLDALHMALRAGKIGPGDSVIIPAFTFVATALAVLQAGATPILVDVKPDTGLLDVSQVADMITPTTRAIIPVHLFGHPVDMDPLMNIARKRGLLVIEDAAQAHGATYKGLSCGSLGDMAGFSFYPTKNLGAFGDGGAVTTSNELWATEIRKLANYGSGRRYHHESVGTNSRLDPLQAAILSEKLQHISAWNEGRDRLANLYREGLRDIPGLRLPTVREWARPVWHVFAIQIADGRRDELAEFLGGRGIGTNIHYPVPIHKHACFAGQKWADVSCPVSERLSRDVLSLPLDALHTEEEIAFVIRGVRAFFGRSG